VIADSPRGDRDRTIVVGAISTASRRARGSTTTAPARRGSSRSPRRSPSCATTGRATACGSRSGVPRRPAWSAPRRTWPSRWRTAGSVTSRRTSTST
jgi:hypothetical protein